MSSGTSIHDVAIIGGGVIGLSLAWDLAQHGAKVCVLDRGPLGNEASWAGAGMIPPGPDRSHWHNATALEQLAGLSQHLHLQWHERLLNLTGIDNEYQRCGALQLARTDDEAASLQQNIARWRQLGIDCVEVDSQALAQIEPAMQSTANAWLCAFHLPAEAQIRNPRHLRALVTACETSGVSLHPNVEVQDLHVSGSRVERLITDEGTVSADQICLATGAWSGKLAESLRLDLPVRPVRGQILLLGGPKALVKRNICLGPCYLVPRRDGRLLVGSTQEEVGFDDATTAAAANQLREFASSLIPATGDLRSEAHWSGLRPATSDGLPYLGRLPNLENAWLATGHFRAGLQLSPATAVVLRAMMLGHDSPTDVSTLGAHRHSSCSA